MTHLIANISKGSTLRRIPSSYGKKITELNGGNYSLLGRDHQTQWFNIAYTSTDKTVITGWVARASVQAIFSGNQTITDAHVPISDYRYNNRPEVRQIMRYRQSQQYTWHWVMCVVGFLSSVGLFLHISSTRDFSHSMGAIVLLIASLILFVAWRGALESKFIYPVRDELKYLDKIRKSKSMKINWGEVAAVVGTVAVAASAVAVAASSANKGSASKSPSKRLPSSTSIAKAVTRTANTVATVSTLASQLPKASIEPSSKYVYEDESEPGFGGAPSGSKLEDSLISAEIKRRQDNGQML